MHRFAAILLFATCWLLPIAASHADPPKPHGPGTLGTNQMKGGDGQFGTTYSVGSNGGVYNLTIVSAEYSVARFNLGPGAYIVPKADEKYLVIHLRVQNPTHADEYISGNTFTFSTVGLDDITRNDRTDLRLASVKATLGDTLKPGQKFPEDLIEVCTVPAVGPVPKLILNMGRVGTSDQVTRFYLGKAPNKVKPLPAPYADPADPTGATARLIVPAKIGVPYTYGKYDIQLTSAAYVPGPIGSTAAGDNNRLFVATLLVTSRLWKEEYTNEFLKAQLKTDDDEKTDMFTLLKGKRDEGYEGHPLDPDDPMTVRVVFVVPAKAKATQLKLTEVLDNTNNQSRAFLFDLSGIQ